MALSSPTKLTSSASFSPSIRISLRLKIHQAQAKNFCRVLDIRVTQIVEADTGESCPLEQRFHVEVGRAGVDRILRLHRVGEYPLTDGIRLAPPQDVRHRLRQDDGTHSLSRFGLADGVLTLPLAVEGAAHLQRAALLVEVAPLQTADLAAAQAGHQFRLEEVPPHLVLLHHCAEGVQLLAGQNALGLVVRLGRSRTLGGVPGNDMGLHCVFQCGVEGGVNVAHHGVGELMPHLRMFVDAPSVFRRRYIRWMSCWERREICLSPSCGLM